jgi:hypothetical protein
MAQGVLNLGEERVERADHRPDFIRHGPGLDRAHVVGIPARQFFG